MSDDKSISMDDFKSKKKAKTLNNREKVVHAYHLFNDKKDSEAVSILVSIPQSYYLIDLHKDIARALLCWATHKTSNSMDHYKESEFYVVIYRMTKHICVNKLMFKNSGYFSELKLNLFKDFDI